MNSFQLKLIAVITMLIDHIGYILLPQMEFLRYIGRISFPIYCFLIAEGARHTHDIYKYFGRLAAFAVVSEIPFNLAFSGEFIDMKSCNVFVTLAFGVAAIICLQKLQNKWVSAGVIAILALLAYCLRSDYSWYGILMIVGFYLAKSDIATLGVQAVGTQFYCAEKAIRYHVGMFSLSQQWSMLSIPVLLLYNGEKGYSGKAIQWAFYLFYPVHLLILFGLSLII